MALCVSMCVSWLCSMALCTFIFVLCFLSLFLLLVLHTIVGGIMIMLHNHRWNNDHVTDPLVLLTGVIYFLDLFKLLPTLEWHWINFHSFSPVVDFNQFVFDFFSLFFCNSLTDLNKLHC